MNDDILNMVKNTAETKSVQTVSLFDIQPGDTLIRHFYGTNMRIVVDKIEDGIVHTIPGWMFYQDTGLEYDPDLGMTRENNLTCSWITGIEKNGN